MLTAGFLELSQLKDVVLPEELRDEISYDTRLERLGMGVAMQLNRHCGRVFEREEDSVYSTTADRTSLSLPRYPVEDISEVVLVCGSSRTDITADIHTQGTASGIVQFSRILGSYDDRVEATYTGGYWLDDGGTQPTGSTSLPWDVQHAFEVQCQAVIEHTNYLGTASARTDKEGRGQPKLADLDLLDVVEKILRPYRRFS